MHRDNGHLSLKLPRDSEHKHSSGGKGDFYFTEKKGVADTRANYVRPLDSSIRSYCLAVTIVFVLIGSVPLLSFLLPYLLAEADTIAVPEDHSINDLIVGGLFFVLASLSAVIVVLDCLSRCLLSRMSLCQLRSRVAKAEKSPRYIAKQSHLRGAKIGACFFSALAVLCGIGLVVRWIIL